MNFFEWVGLGIAAIAGAFTALSRVYKWGPFLPEEHRIVMDYTKEPVPPVLSPTEPVKPVDKVKVFAKAQEQFEGYFMGSSSWRNRNPGNCKDMSGKFIRFATYEDGFAYLEDYIRRVASGKHKAYPKGGKTTFMQYTHVYTADSEPSPTNYAVYLAKALSVPVDTTIDYLLT